MSGREAGRDKHFTMGPGRCLLILPIDGPSPPP